MDVCICLYVCDCMFVLFVYMFVCLFINLLHYTLNCRCIVFFCPQELECWLSTNTKNKVPPERSRYMTLTIQYRF